MSNNKVIAALSIALVLVTAVIVSLVVYTASNHSPNGLRIDDNYKLTTAQSASVKAHRDLANSEGSLANDNSAEWDIMAKHNANRVKNADEDLATANLNHVAAVAKIASLEKATTGLEYALVAAGLLAVGLIISIVLNRKKN